MNRLSFVFSAAAVLLFSLSLVGCDPTCEASAPPMSPEELDNATVGEPYSQEFTAFGLTSAGVEIFALESGELPPGLSLSEDGLLEGTPTTAGEYSFVLRGEPNSDEDSTCTAQPAFGDYTLIVEDEELDG